MQVQGPARRDSRRIARASPHGLGGANCGVNLSRRISSYGSETARRARSNTLESSILMCSSMSGIGGKGLVALERMRVHLALFRPLIPAPPA